MNVSLRAILLVVTGLALATARDSWTQDAARPAALPTPEERKRLEEIASVDRRRLMDLLGVSEPQGLPAEDADPKRPPEVRRAGENATHWTDDAGHFVVRSGWGNWINYDLARADRGFPLPDPLVLKSGEPVLDAATWWARRRPEILADFVSEIYGQVPTGTPKITWDVSETEESGAGGAMIVRRIVGQIDHARHPAATPSLEFTLHLPMGRTGPVPVIVAITGPWPSRVPGAREQVLARGWGYATYDPYALQADTGAKLNEGIIGLANEGRPRTPDQWGALAAWAWGLSRAIDYFETDRAIDVRRLAVQGHSRFGKTALLAAAMDARWATAYVSCSGAGGAKLFRHDFGESLDIVAWSGEYHWMAGNFLKYAGRWNELPVDQHELIALVAPRPVFITAGTDDPWSDPVGMFKACVAAGPVYRLLGQRDLGTDVLPAPDVGLTDGDLAYRLHAGGHSEHFDWPVFLEFAARQFKAR